MQNPLIMKLSTATALSEEDMVVLDRLTTRSFSIDRKTDLIEEGDTPEYVHLVMQGVACRYKMVEDGRRQILALLLPGDFCDLQIALLREMDHSIATLSPCKVVRIPRETVDDLISHYPRLTRALWWATLVDEAILRENVFGLGQRETDRQMAHLFCELHARLQTVGLVQADSFDLPLTQEELGDMLGVSSNHTSRVLIDLRSQHLCEFQRGRVTVFDVGRLRDFAGFRSNYLHLSGIKLEAERKPRLEGRIYLGDTTESHDRASPFSSFTLSPQRRGVSTRSLENMFMANSVELNEKRILVVEDDYFSAEIMTNAVRSLGAIVVGPAANLRDALAIVRSGQAIDAAILDVNLGGDKVFPVADALKEYGIPIVFVTGYDDWMIPSQYKNVPIFRKPTDPDNVVRTLFDQ